MEKPKIDIDLLKTPVFNIVERSNVHIEKLRFEEENIYILGHKKNEYKIETNDSIAITLNLGKYVYESNIIQDIQDYINYYNIREQERFIKFARLDNDFKIAKELKVIENNKVKIYNFDRTEFNFFKDENLTIYLKEWIKFCGIPNKYIKSKKFFISYQEILEIFKYCQDYYLFYSKYYYNFNKANLKFTITYTYLENKELKKEFSTLNDIMNFHLLLFDKKGKEHLKECAHCHKLFIGRKNKLCCSTSCKDYNNDHYGKKIARKLKEQEQKGKEKTENGTNNQQK